jgi:Uma2 family endonuclease
MMTAMVDQPRVSVEEFERLALLAERDELGVRLEYIYGKVGVKPVPDGVHNTIIAWLQRQFMLLMPNLYLFGGNELKVEEYRAGRAVPDASLAPMGAFLDEPIWKNPEQVLLAVEVTSFDSDTHRRDRVEKPAAYAETGIPVYLLVDRENHQCVVYSAPVDGVYSSSVPVPFGDPVELPEPVGVVLETEQLKQWVR